MDIESYTIATSRTRTTGYWKDYLDGKDIPIQHTHVWDANYLSSINILGRQTIGYDIGGTSIASIANSGILTWWIGTFDGQ